MRPGKSDSNAVCRRTRRQLDLFYMNVHQEIKKKRSQESSIVHEESPVKEVDYHASTIENSEKHEINAQRDNYASNIEDSEPSYSEKHEINVEEDLKCCKSPVEAIEIDDSDEESDSAKHESNITDVRENSGEVVEINGFDKVSESESNVPEDENSGVVVEIYDSDKSSNFESNIPKDGQNSWEFVEVDASDKGSNVEEDDNSFEEIVTSLFSEKTPQKRKRPQQKTEVENDDVFKSSISNKVPKTAQKGGKEKPVRPPKKKLCTEDAIDMLVDSIWKEKESVCKVDSKWKEKESLIEEEIVVPVKEKNNNGITLPLKFSLENAHVCPKLEKSDYEKEIDSLYVDLEIGLWECTNDDTNGSMVIEEETISPDNDDSREASCARGDHDVELDEQIGLRCIHCFAVILDIKDILPNFHQNPPSRQRESKDSNKSQKYIGDHIQFQSSNNLKSSSLPHKGTVFDLIPEGVEKELYPHQREGFEFMWRNIAGDTIIKNLEELSESRGGGCIISHAPGTGKTRLAIVFLESFMKLYPNCHPVIIAPKGMLLTWEQEFKKWNVELNFHNLNEDKLSDVESTIATDLLKCRGDEKDTDYIRFVKLYSWMKGKSVLGVSYRLFERLAGEDNGKFRKILLELPGLLVLDEGHTPRNNQSQMWKALTNLKSHRRVILSGTPFQNNFSELYNTLCLVNPRNFRPIKAKRGRPLSNAASREWTYLTSSITSNTSGKDEVKQVQSIIEPYVHVHKGSILQKTLPGMKDCLVLLKPSDIQSQLLRNNYKVEKYLDQAYLASLISIHPSLVAKNPNFTAHKQKLENLESDANAGVKTQFLMELIRLSDQLGEKVLIFSQFIDPLVHIKKLLKSHFAWNEGHEVIYMDGLLSLKKRQNSINSFNDKKGEAKVMLASQRACSEGIHLVGASRVVLLDVVWNPSVERQAISRAYRIGQERIVYVYHLVTLMELKKYVKQAEKDRISEMIFSSGDSSGKVSSDSNSDSCIVEEDQVLEAMVGSVRLNGIFERIVHQPKEHDLVDNFGFVDKSVVYF